MKREIDNRMKRIVVFTIINTIMKFKANPDILSEEVEDLTMLCLSGLMLAIHGDKYEPYPFDVGSEWVEMYKGVEESMERNFPELFSKIIIS